MRGRGMPCFPSERIFVMSERRCYGCMQIIDGDFCPHCGWPKEKNNEPHQLPVGTVLRDQYVVGRVLGQGGFGITYLGWDRHLESAVCIKEYFPNHAVSRDCTVSTQVHCHTEQGAAVYRASKERFLREGKILAQFRDIPEIVSIYGFFEENDTVYIVMEYIKGMDLAHYVYHKGGRLTADETFRILKPVMEALAQVHRAELVHRDIAPDNIMLHPRGGAKLLDFGAARMVENADVDKGLDRSTEAIVKHGFAPMEQYQTRGNLGPWTDVYAMCATVYYCLTGQIPPEATTRMMGEADFGWGDVPGLTQRQRFALEKGMAILPKERYASMDELLDGLFGSAPIAQTTPQPAPVYRAPQPEKSEKKKKSGKGLLMGLAAVLAVLVLGIGGFFIATMLQGALQVGVEAPAIEAPAAEAPATETPVAEAPKAEEEYYSFCLFQMGGAMDSFGEELIGRMEQNGLSFSAEVMSVGSEEEIILYTEMKIALGECDAVIIQTGNPDDGFLSSVVNTIADNYGIPIILVGDDPFYDDGKSDFVGSTPGVCYVGVDPRAIADKMVMVLCQLPDYADKNSNGSIGSVFLGAEFSTEAQKINVRIPQIMAEMGFGYSLLAEHYTDDQAAAAVLTDTLTSYGDQIEVIFCTDSAMACGAVVACEMAGIDMTRDVAIIGVGDPEILADYYADGYLAGYVNYSREQLVDTTAEVLIRVLGGEEITGRYLLPCEVYSAGTNTSTDKMMAEVTASDLNIRSIPSTGAESVGSYKKGEIVEILQIQKVSGTEWGLTKDGWIDMNYVRILE